MDPAVLALGLLGPVAFAAIAGRYGRAGAAAGLSLGWILGAVAIGGVPKVPPNEASHWLVVAAVVAFGWGVATRLPRAADLVARLVFLAALLRVMLAPMVEYTWSGGVAIVWIAGLAVAGTAAWAGLEAVAARVPGRAFLTGLAAWGGGVGMALAATGSVKLGMVGGAFGLALLGVASAALTGGRPDVRGVVPGAVIVGLGLVLCGAFFASTPAPVAVALALAPGAMLLAQGAPGRLPWRAPLVVGLPVFVAILAGAWLTGAFAPAEADPYAY